MNSTSQQEVRHFCVTHCSREMQWGCAMAVLCFRVRAIRYQERGYIGIGRQMQSGPSSLVTRTKVGARTYDPLDRSPITAQ
jgi:hypothetical protein